MYELSVLHQLPITNLDLLIYGCMSVESTPGHIPRYMGQTSNNNKTPIITHGLACNWVIPLALPYLLSLDFTLDFLFCFMITTCVLFY